MLSFQHKQHCHDSHVDVSYCVKVFCVDSDHDRAPFVLVVVVALLMLPFLIIFSKVSKFCGQICGLGLSVRFKAGVCNRWPTGHNPARQAI